MGQQQRLARCSDEWRSRRDRRDTAVHAHAVTRVHVHGARTRNVAFVQARRRAREPSRDARAIFRLGLLWW